jgi:hypothetical protein
MQVCKQYCHLKFKIPSVANKEWRKTDHIAALKAMEQRLALLFHILEVLGSNFNWETI